MAWSLERHEEHRRVQARFKRASALEREMMWWTGERDSVAARGDLWTAALLTGVAGRLARALNRLKGGRDDTGR